MRERFLTGYNDFVRPFVFGMLFVLTYCLIGMIRLIMQLPAKDRKRFFLSLITPKILFKDIKDIFLKCLIHVDLWKRNKLLGYMHSSIAFGWFMIILVGHIEVFLYTSNLGIKALYYPIFFRYFVAETESTMKGSLIFFLMDFFLLVILSGIALAIIKRVRSRFFGMRRTTNPSFLDLVGLYSLWAIFPLRLLAESFTADISGGSFLTKSLNYVFTEFLSNHANMLPAWWAYSCALGIFFCVLPFTRYMHIPTEILLIPLRNAGIRIVNARKGLAKAQVYSCPSCGLCIDACPMGVMKSNIKDTTVYLNRQIRRNNEARIEEISDKCLLCAKCTAVCPVGVEGDKLRIAQRSMRRYNFGPDYSNIDTSVLSEQCNKFVINQNKNVSLTDSKRVLYFSGCMTALTPAIRKATESLLGKAGIEYEIMDRDGGICCGRPMFMAGRFDQAEQMVRKNTEIILGGYPAAFLPYLLQDFQGTVRAAGNHHNPPHRTFRRPGFFRQAESKKGRYQICFPRSVRTRTRLRNIRTAETGPVRCGRFGGGCQKQEGKHLLRRQSRQPDIEFRKAEGHDGKCSDESYRSISRHDSHRLSALPEHFRKICRQAGGRHRPGT